MLVYRSVRNQHFWLVRRHRQKHQRDPWGLKWNIFGEGWWRVGFRAAPGTLKRTSLKASEKWMGLEYDCFLLGPGLFSGALAVSFGDRMRTLRFCQANAILRQRCARCDERFFWYGKGHMGVSKNRGGPPKSSILIRISIIFTIHFGAPLFLVQHPWSLDFGISGSCKFGCRFTASMLKELAVTVSLVSEVRGTGQNLLMGRRNFLHRSVRSISDITRFFFKKKRFAACFA